MYCLLRVENNQMYPSEIPKSSYDILIDGYSQLQEVIDIFKGLDQYKNALVELEKWCRSVDTDSALLVKNQEIAERMCQGILTAFKNYLEHLKKHIKDKYGTSSSFYALYGTSRENARKTSDEFTFVYELRNYAQHQNSVVHSFLNTKPYLQPASIPSVLLSQYTRWNQREKTYISNHPRGIDLQAAFEKAYTALGLIHQPVIQYLLDNSDAGKNFSMFRIWMDKTFSREEAKFYSLATVERKDGVQATMDDYKHGVPDLEFRATVIDWNMIYQITDALSPKK